MVAEDLPQRVTITGVAGMLGSSLARRLHAEGCEVRGLDLREIPSAVGTTHVVGDVRDRSAVSSAITGADAVVHCAAALPSYPREQIQSVIVDGTTCVLTVARQLGVPRVVHVSSTAVYGLPRRVPTPETHPREPVDPYSSAKAAAEEIVDRFRADGMCLPVLRPKTFLGPGRMGLFAMLFEWASEGRNFPVLGRGDVRIQMLDLDDLLDAVVTVLRATPEIADDTYNIGAAEFGSLRDDFQAVLDAAGYGARVVSIPARPAAGVLRLLEAAQLSPVYGRLVHKLLFDSYVSIEKARERLGFTPRHSNRDAILRTFEWWRAHGSADASGVGGRTSRDPWRQGALGMTKALFGAKRQSRVRNGGNKAISDA